MKTFIVLIFAVCAIEDIEAVPSCMTNAKGVYGEGTAVACDNNLSESCEDVVYLKADRSGYEFEKRCSDTTCADPAAVLINYVDEQESTAIQCCSIEDCNIKDLQTTTIGPKCIDCVGTRSEADTCVQGTATTETAAVCDAKTSKCKSEVKADGSVIRECALTAADAGDLVTAGTAGAKYCTAETCNTDSMTVPAAGGDGSTGGGDGTTGGGDGTTNGDGDSDGDGEGDGEDGATTVFVSYTVMLVSLLLIRLY